MTEIEHLLSCLAEECSEISKECAEVAVRVSKALRFGLDESQQGQLLNNAERISLELADLLAVAEMLEAVGVITRVQVEAKKERVATYMKYVQGVGQAGSTKHGVSLPHEAHHPKGASSQ